MMKHAILALPQQIFSRPPAHAGDDQVANGFDPKLTVHCSSTLGVIVCGAMIYGLGWTNWVRLAAWLVIGLLFYFGYARSHSRLAVEREFTN